MEVVSYQDTEPKSEKMSYSGAYWRMDEPPEPGTYMLMLKDCGCAPQYEEWEWDGEYWSDDYGHHNPNVDGEIKGWIPMPKPAEEVIPKAAPNASCITGISPYGICGAAACCDNECTCCLQCDKNCNSRCGWIDDEAEVMTE
jgi:hypothetical protein